MIFSLSLLSLIVPLLANGAKVSTSGPVNSIVPGSYIIELETGGDDTLSKRSGDQPYKGNNVEGLLSSVLTHLAKPVTATIEGLTGTGGGDDSGSKGPSTKVNLPKFATRRTYKALPQIFAGAVVSADDLPTKENGEEANWEDVVKGLETIQGVKVSFFFLFPLLLLFFPRINAVKRTTNC